MEANLADGDSSWSIVGDVQLQHGSLTLSAERMIVKREQGEITSVVAQGSPVRFTQSKPNLVTATSASMTYSVNDQLLVLAGNVELVQASNEVRGERIEYDLLKGELVAGSTDPKDGQQIEFVLDDAD